MIKINVEFGWGTKQKESFSLIKESIMQASTLMSPSYDKYFIMCTFSSDTSFMAILTQKSNEHEEFSVSFMSFGLQNVELKYYELDKQVFAVFKEVKHFRPYLLKSNTKVIVRYPIVRNFLVQKELGETIAHWMTSLQEYGLEIKPAKIVIGQGL